MSRTTRKEKREMHWDKELHELYDSYIFKIDDLNIHIMKAPHWGEFCAWIHFCGDCMVANKPIGTSDVETAQSKALKIAHSEVVKKYNKIFKVKKVLDGIRS